MFGWFKPHCPLDAAAKAWMESKLLWLGDEFGMDVFTRRAMVLPTEDFFPDAYDGSQQSVRRLLDRVCLYMDADTQRVELEIYKETDTLMLVTGEGHAIPTAAGTYEEEDSICVIRLEASQLRYPMDLIGTMAHELAHLRLLGEQRYDDSFDNELLTDLTVVFHGMGLFLANSPRAWMSGFTQWPGTELRKPEYLTAQMYGYALAHQAWLVGVSKPRWYKHLNWSARANFKESMRYLEKTGDTALFSRRKAQ